MSRAKLWSFDTVHVDLEDLDVMVKAIHKPTLTEIEIRFRAKEEQISGEVDTLKQRLETFAGHMVLDFASFLDSAG